MPILLVSLPGPTSRTSHWQLAMGHRKAGQHVSPWAGKGPRLRTCICEGAPCPGKAGGPEAPPRERALETAAGAPPREVRRLFSHVFCIPARRRPAGSPASACLSFGLLQETPGFPAFFFLSVRSSLTYRFLTVPPDQS